MIDIWQQSINFIAPVTLNITKRKTKWAISCDKCQNERIVSYCQAWNIVTGKFTRSCEKCSGCKRKNSGSFKKDFVPWNKGISWKRTSGKGNSNLCEYRNLFDNPVNFPGVKQKQRNSKLGKFQIEANAYKGALTSERKLAQNRDEYKQLRKNCYKRDDYTCQHCSERGGNLEMHHIKEWCNYPELRYELTNVITLCPGCHKKTDNYANKAKRKL